MGWLDHAQSWHPQPSPPSPPEEVSHFHSGL